MIKNTKQKWIELGYQLFATEGAEGIQVERLARILKLNKSGFYHYFKTHDNFLTELFNYHQSIAVRIAKEIQGCETLDPDCFKVVIKYKLFALVQGQLARRANNALFVNVLTKVRAIINIPLLPLWRKAFNLPDNKELVLQHFSLFKNAFNAQANIDNLTYEFLHNMMIESCDMMREVFRHQRVANKRINQFENETIVINGSVHG